MESLVLSAKYLDNLSGQPSHYHDCHQLLFISEGEADVIVGKSKFSASRGSLILTNRFENHSLTIRSSTYRRYYIRITPMLPHYADERDRLLSILTDRNENFTNVIDVSRHFERFNDFFSAIAKEYSCSQKMKSLRSDILLFDLLILLYREYPELFTEDGDKKIDVIRDMELRFREDYNQEYSLSSLSEDYHLNRYYLSHLFKKVTGYSVMEYLSRCRLTAAKRYLTATDLPIGDIVEKCGFRDNSDFSRLFKSQNGMSPSEFRKTFSK